MDREMDIEEERWIKREMDIVREMEREKEAQSGPHPLVGRSRRLGGGPPLLHPAERGGHAALLGVAVDVQSVCGAQGPVEEQAGHARFGRGQGVGAAVLQRGGRGPLPELQADDVLGPQQGPVLRVDLHGGDPLHRALQLQLCGYGRACNSAKALAGFYQLVLNGRKPAVFSASITPTRSPGPSISKLLFYITIIRIFKSLFLFSQIKSIL